MRFDEETWDNMYEIPAELSPVIEFLTNRDRDRGEALRKIYDVTQQFDTPDAIQYPHAMINSIQALIPEELKPL